MTTRPSNAPPATSADQTDGIRPSNIRQHMLEDGGFLDISDVMFAHPPPKPNEFLYLQHYYYSPSGIRQELKDCGSVEAAVDILATELGGMQRLLAGYVANLKRYEDKFDAEHQEMQQDLVSLAESYRSVADRIQPFIEQSGKLSQRLATLEYYVANLRPGSRKPPTIIRGSGAGLHDPPMTKEELLLRKKRKEELESDVKNIDCVEQHKTHLKRCETVEELTSPPTPTPPAQPAETKTKRPNKGKGKQRAASPPPQPAPAIPIDPRVSVKIEKLGDALFSMRDAVQRAGAATDNVLGRIRVLRKHQRMNVEEVWQYHADVSDKLRPVARKDEVALRRVDAYTRWALKCGEDEAKAAERKKPATANASPSSAAPESQMPTTDGSPSSEPAAPQMAATSSAGSDIYTVRLDLAFEKKLEDLTREEAIDMLKALPMSIHFVPFGTPKTEGEDDIPPARTASTAPEASADVPPPVRVGEPTSVPNDAEIAAPPTESASNTIAEALQKPPAKTRAKKRGRTSEDVDAEVTTAVRDGHADPRAAAGAVPVKKMRVRKD